MADLKSIGDQATSDLTEDLTALRDDISRLSASVLELVQQQAATTKVRFSTPSMARVSGSRINRPRPRIGWAR
ncbi:MAG: hypothetical protein WDN29_07200 [Methylovirgula sp.]